MGGSRRSQAQQGGRLPSGHKAASFEGAIAFAQDLIRIPSLPGEEGPLAERVVAEMHALGFDEVRVDELGSVIGVVRGAARRPCVMLSAHLDMVSAGDLDEWEVPPFEGVVRDGYLHGRGAMDIKGPLAIQTHVAAALGGKVAGDIVVAHPVFEERGGWGMDHLVRPGGGLSPDVVIIGESTGGDIAIGHRGRSEVEVVGRGLAGHASAPDRARNALDFLPPILAGVRALNESLDTHPALGRSSVVATGVDAVPRSLNVIPDRVTVTLDWRILPADTQESLVAIASRAIRSQMDRHAPPGWSDSASAVTVRVATQRQRAYTGIQEDRRIFSPGFLMDPQHPAVLAASRAVGVRGNPRAPARVRPWRFATDGGWTCGMRGIPTIGFAPGEERHAHTNTERLDIEEARWAYGRYLKLVPAVQESMGEEATARGG